MYTDHLYSAFNSIAVGVSVTPKKHSLTELYLSNLHISNLTMSKYDEIYLKPVELTNVCGCKPIKTQALTTSPKL